MGELSGLKVGGGPLGKDRMKKRDVWGKPRKKGKASPLFSRKRKTLQGRGGRYCNCKRWSWEERISLLEEGSFA